MASFGQQFIASLTQPSYSEGMFKLGSLIGAQPALMAERKAEQDRLARIDQSFEKTMQGTAAAQQGDVSAVTNRMDELRQLMTQAKTVEEKSSLAKQIQSLSSMLPTARTTQTQNKAKAIINAEQALKSGKFDALTPADEQRARQALRDRIDVMRQDPDAVEQYNAYKLDQWRTDKAQEQMESEAWIKSNQASIVDAVKDADLEAIDALQTKAAEKGFGEAFSTYLNTVSQNQKTTDYLAERHVRETKKPNLNYDDTIAALPEELRPVVESMYERYKSYTKDNWSEKNGWTQGSVAQAQKLEDALIKAIDGANVTIADSAFREAQRLKASREEQIFKLEQQLNDPLRDEDVNRRALQLAKNDAKKQYKFIEQARRELREERTRDIMDDIAALQGPQETPEGAVKKLGKHDAAQFENGYQARDTDGTLYVARNGMWVPQLEEVTPTGKRRKAVVEQRPNIYSESFITKGAEAVGRGFEAVGQALEAKGQTARKKLEENPFKGVS